MRVFVTKYALVAGIEVWELNRPSPDSPFVHTEGRYIQGFTIGKNAFLTYAEAAVGARKMRDKKVASLNKQLSKISGLIFPEKMPDELKESQ